MAGDQKTDDAFDLRFGGIRRLLGTAGVDVLRRSHVCVIGIGGVGSWVVEALARSALGALTVIDWDDVCITNVNRQLHALDGDIGRPKVAVMAERVAKINPDCRFHVRHEFFTEANAGAVLDQGFDYVVDAVDGVSAKCLLIRLCRRHKLPVLTIGGAGGRLDPTRIRVEDLSRSYKDPLLARVRKELRVKHGFPRGRERFKVDCVYSPEEILYPQADGTVCRQKHIDGKMKLDCRSGYGTASFVTGAFGFAAAARVVQRLIERAERKK